MSKWSVYNGTLVNSVLDTCGANLYANCDTNSPYQISTETHVSLEKARLHCKVAIHIGYQDDWWQLLFLCHDFAGWCCITLRTVLYWLQLPMYAPLTVSGHCDITMMSYYDVIECNVSVAKWCGCVSLSSHQKMKFHSPILSGQLTHRKR